MPESDEKSRSFMQSDERFKYIGFEVFPGKAGNIFRSDEERKSLIEKVMRKLNRSEGEVRDKCTLMDERVSRTEQMILTIASVALVICLFLPWFSGYHETTTTRYVPYETESTETAQQPSESANPGVVDSMAAMGASDTVAQMAATDTTTGMAAVNEAETGLGEAEEAPAGETETSAGTNTSIGGTPEEMRAVVEVHRDYKHLSGIGALAGIGTYGGMIFSSGWVLAVTGVLMIVFILSCLVLAVLNLYVIFGAKKPTAEEKVLYLKKMLKINWFPVFLWLAMFILSFFGAGYSFDSEGMIKQVGDSYWLSTFIGLTSWGIIVAVGSFLVLALKGKEI